MADLEGGRTTLWQAIEGAVAGEGTRIPTVVIETEWMRLPRIVRLSFRQIQEVTSPPNAGTSRMLGTASKAPIGTFM